MNAFAFSPAFRSGLGFDRMVNAVESAGRAGTRTYPPYDVEKTGDNQFRITLAAPGIKAEQLELEAFEGVLRVSAKPADDDDSRQFLHRGLHGLAFERRFQLAEHMNVTDARLEDGLLRIDLVYEVPEALRPRTIAVQTATSEAPAPKKLEQSAADQERQAA